MRLGIIGSGMIVREFLPELVRMDALSVQALLCTPRSLEQAEQLAAQYGIGRVVTSMQALCRLGARWSVTDMDYLEKMIRMMQKLGFFDE